MEPITSMYLHIPFCKSICTYCDFAKMYYEEKLVLPYIDALKREVNSEYKGEVLKTLYVGGGTPSHLSKDALNKLFQVIDTFSFFKEYEFTFECNIEDIDSMLLQFLKDHRVNRLSIGVETFQEKFLSFLGRHHTREETFQKIKLIHAFGFTNINIDLMYAFPNQTLMDIEKDIEDALKCDVTHISSYSLIIEDHTLLGIRHTNPIDQEYDYEMYQLLENKFEKAGFVHYEVSNYAKPGFESKHNQVYWKNERYYGFGLGASGYINHLRYTNTRSLKHYLSGNRILEEEKITVALDQSYTLILGLRLLKGIAMKDFYQKYGKTIFEVYDIMDLIEDHLLEEVDGYLRIPKDKIYLSNQVLIRFL